MNGSGTSANKSLGEVIIHKAWVALPGFFTLTLRDSE